MYKNITNEDDNNIQVHEYWFFLCVHESYFFRNEGCFTLIIHKFALAVTTVAVSKKYKVLVKSIISRSVSSLSLCAKMRLFMP